MDGTTSDGVVPCRASTDPPGTTLSSLDPRAPFVLDTVELGRRPGSQRRMTRSVPAPSGLAIDVIGVPAGSRLDLQVRLEAVMEGVLVTGTVRAQLVGECARCLGAVEDGVEVDLQELYAYADDPAVLTADDTSRLDGDYLDLEPLVRDQLVLALPFVPRCSEDCPGLCPRCGTRLADEPGHDHGTDPDPRWAALTALTQPGPSAGPASGADEE